ncbi:TetR family transcriptional regulator [Acrocarpospora corrugata]|uniref:TetR family transcriptional regulator n=1 Tax=Acrocarpospora corrugata TaxID=35763 RepID=A0A5M3VYR9_9ACTN|nr:TetR/AcrR family transcriptional regulator [Acrocarpospora corrugata]GES01656.1 TetR family transcriptional regulator [Acrocarpospora corrugata]
MGRLSRAQLQARNRDRVLAAARQEFAEHGFRGAKVDTIADRAGFTRGAVYSNFPGKRALYFAVLADLAEQAPQAPAPEARDAQEALGALARAWLARLPLADEPEPARLIRDLHPEILAEERTRRPYAQLLKLDAILLGLALEHLTPAPGRQVRLAESVLATLHGARQLSAAAPGFVQPFDVVSVCERLAGLDLGDWWPILPWIPSSADADEVWAAPYARDLFRGEAAHLDGDGVVAVLGLNRLEAVEEAVRAGSPVTAILVTADPDELAPLARLVIAELGACLREAFPPSAWPDVRIVVDSGELAATAGIAGPGDDTEVALRVRDGRIVLRAEGRGACHLAASGHEVRR